MYTHLRYQIYVSRMFKMMLEREILSMPLNFLPTTRGHFMCRTASISDMLLCMGTCSLHMVQENLLERLCPPSLASLATNCCLENLWVRLAASPAAIWPLLGASAIAIEIFLSRILWARRSSTRSCSSRKPSTACRWAAYWANWSAYQLTAHHCQGNP